MEDAAFVLRGIRNGAYYGTKIRAPHAAGACCVCTEARAVEPW